MPIHRPPTLPPPRPRTISGLCALWILCLIAAPAAARQVADTMATDFVVEALLEDLDDTLGDPVQLVERLDELLTDPLDVNTAPAEALAEVPSIGPVTARNLVLFRETNGPFDTLDEVGLVDGMTVAALEAARPYLTLHKPDGAAASFLQRFFRDTRVEWLQRAGRRFDLGRGYAADTAGTRYAGSPDRLYTRLRVRSRHLSLNTTMEKDPGERFSWDPASGTYGFDHVSAHLALHASGPLKTLVVGDFTAHFGQGVVLWSSSAFGKGGASLQSLIRTGRGIVPYGSVEENHFFRGVATTIAARSGVSVSAFASRRTLDAALTTPHAAEAERFDDQEATTGLSGSGLHRTPTEMSRKDALREDLVGGNLDVRTGPVHVGVVGYHTSFDRPFRPGPAPYQRYQFAGQRATLVSAYADAFIGPLHVFGEVARAPDAVPGGVGGLLLRLTDATEMLFLTRHYPRHFVSLHGYAFGERNGATTNETGYYLGVRLLPGPTWRIAAFFDLYRFPWVRFGVPRPSTGYEMAVSAEHRPRRWLTLSLQVRSEIRETGASHRDPRGFLLDAVLPETRRSFRLQGEYRFSPRLLLRARLDGVRVTPWDAPTASGLALLQDLRWHPFKHVRLDLRLLLFDTDTFAARVFTHENDVLNTFSVPSFSGRGQRAYVLIQWTPTPHLTLQAKVAATRFEDVRSVGTGLDAVEGNRLREARALVRWRY